VDYISYIAVTGMQVRCVVELGSRLLILKKIFGVAKDMSIPIGSGRCVGLLATIFFQFYIKTYIEERSSKWMINGSVMNVKL